MSPPAPVGPMNDTNSEFEKRTRELLEDSVQRVDGRIRSRLNQARHAAIEEATKRPSVWRRFSLMPAAGAISLVWLIGAYALVFGALLLASAIRFKNAPAGIPAPAAT